MSIAYATYADVPWYRRSGMMSLFVLAGGLVVPPLLWAACIILVTGDVYYRR